MDPTGPAQPPSSAAYTTTGNPADQSPAELGAAATPQGRNTGPIVDRRHQGDLPVPSSPLGSGTPSALGYGGKGSDDPDVGQFPTSLHYWPFLSTQPDWPRPFHPQALTRFFPSL